MRNVQANEILQMANFGWYLGQLIAAPMKKERDTSEVSVSSRLASISGGWVPLLSIDITYR